MFESILEYIKKEWFRLLTYVSIAAVAAWVTTGTSFSADDYSKDINDSRVTTLFVGDGIRQTPQIPEGEQIMATSTVAETDTAGKTITREDGSVQTRVIQYITNGETIIVTEAPTAEVPPVTAVTTASSQSGHSNGEVPGTGKKSTTSTTTTTTGESRFTAPELNVGNKTETSENTVPLPK